MIFSNPPNMRMSNPHKKLSSNLNSQINSFKQLEFEDQSFLLSQAIYDKISQLYEDESLSRKVTQMLADLDPSDFFEVLEIMENDDVLKKWVNKAARSAGHF